MRAHAAPTALLSALLALPGCGPAPTTVAPAEPAPAPAPEPGVFEDVTAGSGLAHTYRNGDEAEHFAILESLGGGAALIDYDGDGLLDVFLAGGGYYGGANKQDIKGHPCRLFKNLGGFKFRDVTGAAGLDRLGGGEPWFYTHGAAVADYDNDGWPDLLVTGWGRLALLHSEPDGNGGRRFADVTKQAGLTGTSWCTSAAWGDFDGNGFADLYVCQYVDWSFANNPPCKDYREQKVPDVCPPKSFTALPHLLYRNNGDGTFAEAGAAAGLRRPRADADYDRLTHLSAEERAALKKADAAKDFGKGLGVLALDADDDGRLDLYVANDTTANFLYLNRGGGRFAEVGLERGVAYDDNATPNGSMGVDAADYTASGALSIFVTNYQHEAHALYRNRGKGHFVFSSRSAGIAAVGLVYVGFGTGFLDYDRDGREDIVISNGHVVRFPPPPAEVRQRPLLLRNLGKPGDAPHAVRFDNVTAGAGPFFQGPHLGRGLALGDLDNDGRTDLVLSPMNEPAVVLRDRHENGHHWLGVELVGRPSRDAVGARLELDVGGTKLVRAIKGGGSYLSAGDRRVVFGLGTAAKVGRLTVRWPSGKTQTWDGLAVDGYVRLTEGEAEPSAPTRR